MELNEKINSNQTEPKFGCIFHRDEFFQNKLPQPYIIEYHYRYINKKNYRKNNQKVF